ncbi:MAG: acetolactate synthase small subunit [Candidatus Methanomethylophilaceae archaeon]|nr:acetolactate synthase small subunit [Candidatus Methanomethylophilaceae archaeon]MDI3541216.1 acetolactate synthase small subunit [Candidatus Methanomethylophilaceae archaeon]HIJ00609.1 acetolactate synthase [Candidatus Methanomethylophilaceae archaeon]
MEVISMIVNDEFGVMQRIMGEFTRKRINVETIVVGKCEVPGKARIVLTVLDKEMADIAVERLGRLHDVEDVEIVDESRQSAYALISTSKGWIGLVGSRNEVAEIIERARPEHYINTVNAL